MDKIADFWNKSDKLFLAPLLLSVFLILLITAMFFLFYSHLPQKLPLFYSVPWGSNQLAAKQQFLLLPAVLLFITLVNSLLVSQLHAAQLVLRRILMLNLILVATIIFITSIKILFIFI